MVVKKVIVGIVLAACLSMSFAATNHVVYGRSVSNNEALILFYMSSCPHCKRFDPVVAQYAKAHHMQVLAYTLDGHALPSFPKSVVPNQEELARFFPDGHPVVPTLYLMSSSRHKIYPVLKGEASGRDLSDRINRVEELEINRTMFDDN